MEADIGYRNDYLNRFNTERDRILSQVEINREAQQPYNELAAAQLPSLEGAATPGGYTDRVGELAGDPAMQRIIDRQNQQRMREANAQLAAGGLSRSGAATEAAARNTQTYDEFAMDKEQQLFDRSLALTGLHKDLPIANQMVANTFAYDSRIADNLTKQGETRANADLLMGQISNEAAETMLGNLLKVYGAATSGGGTGVDISITNEIENSVSDFLGGLVQDLSLIHISEPTRPY